jgi:hypothetical protein
MWMATMWRSNAVIYVTVPYKYLSLSFFLTSQLEVDFGITHITRYATEKQGSKGKLLDTSKWTVCCLLYNIRIWSAYVYEAEGQ